MRIRVIGSLVVLWLALLPSMAAWGKEYRVSSAAEVATAMTTAQPDDTLTLVNGTWANQLILFAGNGSALSPIILRAETAGEVILTGTSRIEISGTYLVVKGLYFKNGDLAPAGGKPVISVGTSSIASQYCRVTETAIENYNPPDSSIEYKWVSIYGSHNEVDHCTFRMKRNIGALLVVWRSTTDPNYHSIHDNHFLDRPNVSPDNGFETIRVGTSDQSLSSSFTIVEHNLFERCNGEIEIISNKSCDNIYRYNTFRGNDGMLTLRHGNRCRVEGNYFFGEGASGSGGVRVIGEDHTVVNNYFQDLKGNSGFRQAIVLVNGKAGSLLNEYYQVKRPTIAFNTAVNCSYNIGIGETGGNTQLTLAPESCSVANNIIKSSTSNTLIRQTTAPIGMVWEGNIFMGSNVGTVPPAGYRKVDPLLQNSSNGWWKLSSLSPAIDSAVGAYGSILEDIEGEARTLADIGADEYSVSFGARQPLSAGDVGASWYYQQVTIAAGREEPPVPEFRLDQNFPNPFNPVTLITFNVPGPGRARVSVFDLVGRRVAVLFDREVSDRSYTVAFDGSQLSSGTYVAVLEYRDRRVTRKMVLLK